MKNDKREIEYCNVCIQMTNHRKIDKKGGKQCLKCKVQTWNVSFTANTEIVSKKLMKKVSKAIGKKYGYILKIMSKK